MDTNTMCIIILILACVSILVYLLYRIKKDGLRETVIKLIVVAERNFKSGEGKKKMETVIASIHDFIPFPLNIILTETAISTFCQTVFDEIKEALEYGNK